jgi:chromate transporter
MMPQTTDRPALAAPPSLTSYALLVLQVGLTSFGGGVSAWMMRLVVEERGWMTESEFLTGLALCQVFPGVNVLNLAIWLGYRLRGGVGAIVGALTMIIPPGLVLIGIATAFAGVSHEPRVHAALNGVAAAAVGLVAAMGLRAGRRAATGPVPILFAIATTLLVGVLHWPLVPVVLVLSAASIGLCLRQT